MLTSSQKGWTIEFPSSSTTPYSYNLLIAWLLWLSSSTCNYKRSFSYLKLLTYWRKLWRSSFRLVSNSLTSSISCLFLFLFEESFIMSADLPLDAMKVSDIIRLTAEVLALTQCPSKFRSHIDVEMLAKFNFDFSSFHGVINHLLYTIRVQCIHQITDPLLIHVNPVTGVWQKF